MKSIESSSNPRIKAVRSLIQKNDYSEYWLIEGKTLVHEAIASGVLITNLFVEDESAIPGGTVSGQIEVYRIPGKLMKSISTLETPPGIVAVARRPESAQEHRIERFAALLASIRDPGNLGAIVRSAEATGCEFVACSQDSADPFQPKAIRASMGSIFRTPAFKIPDLLEFVSAHRRHGVRVHALHPRRGTDFQAIDVSAPSLIVIGGETAGIPDSIEVDEWIRIPMHGNVESLNAAMAATLCFYRFMSVRS